MAIQLVSANLNPIGDNGDFNTDRSTWGVSDLPYMATTRSLTNPYEGVGSALVTAIEFSESGLWTRLIAYGKLSNAVAGKKYVAKARIRTSSAAPIASDNVKFYFALAPSAGSTILYEVQPSVSMIKDTWYEIEFRVACTNNIATWGWYLVCSGTTPEVMNVGNSMNVDSFKIYEYIDQVCNLLQAFPTITHETIQGSNNGSVAGNVTSGNSPFQWRLLQTDFTVVRDWQDSNLFSNLAPATYRLHCREKNNPSCTDQSKTATVNAAPLFQYQISKTDVTTPGGSDGTITVTVSGPGAPFSYSKDGGATWVSSGIFTALSSGAYNVYVKDSVGHIQGGFIVVNDGAYTFDFIVNVSPASYGNNDGQIQITPTGTGGPFTFSIDGGSVFQSSDTFSGLAPATYSVVVKSAGGIKRNKTTVVPQAASTFNFTVTATNETVFGANDGSITFNASGSGAPYEYSIDNGSTYLSSNVFTGLPPNLYYVKVRNTFGAVQSSQAIVNVGVVVFDKVWFSRNPVIYGAVAQSGWEAVVNARVYDDVRVDENNDGNFISKLKIDLPPEANGSVTFQVRQAFRKVLTATPPLLNSNAIIQLTDRIKTFKHYIGSLQDDQTTPDTLTPSLPHFVMLGGISKSTWPSINFFTSYLPTKKNFLTWAPIQKQVDKNQEDYLNYFVFAKNTKALKLKIKAYFDDETNATSVTQTKMNVLYGQLYQVPAGPINCGVLAINPTKNLVKYELSLLDQSDSLISEVRTYLIDPISHPRKKLFMFLNSLGSYEVLRFTGVGERSVEIGKEQVAKFLPYNYSPLDGEIEVNSSLLRNSASLSSGYLDGDNAVAWLDYLQDFLLSKSVFDVTDGKRRRVIVPGGNFPMNSDQNFERFIRFNVIDVYEDESYTPLSI